MKRFLLIIALLMTNSAFAREFRLLELDEARIDFIQFAPGGRDPMITANGLPNRQLGQLLDLNIDTTVAKYGYWRSLVHSYTDSYASTNTSGQFRVVGLNMEVGVRVTPLIDVFLWHYSQHELDNAEMPGGYPEQDGIGVHIYLFSNKRKESIFGFGG